jgi:hypothetical protein
MDRPLPYKIVALLAIAALLLVGLCFRVYHRWTRSVRPLGPAETATTRYRPHEQNMTRNTSEATSARLYERARSLAQPTPLSKEAELLFDQQVQQEKASLSQEMQAIDEIFQIPCVQKFVTAIQKRLKEPPQDPEADTPPQHLPFHTKDMVAILLVILGIKPALTFNAYDWDKFLLVYTAFDEITAHFPYVKLVKNAWHQFVVNESPLPIFDPRRYLVNCQSMAEEILTHFPNQNTAVADQRLSYLLGFGPTWEALFLHNIHQNRRYTASKEYQPLHFQQLGESIKRVSQSPLTEEELGRSYHGQVVNGEVEPRQIESEHVLHLLFTTGTSQAYDKLSMQTTYFKQSCFLKQHVLNKINPSQN